jgi:hypothetical protein
LSSTFLTFFVFGVVQLLFEFVQGGVFQLGRVGGGVDLLEFADGDLGVNLGKLKGQVYRA